MQTTIVKQYLIAFVGFLLLLPALIMMLAIASHKWFGFSEVLDYVDFSLFFFHPITMMLWVGLAFLLNLIAIVDIKVVKKRLSIKIKPHFSYFNLNILILCILLALVILIFLAVKNLWLFG